MVQINTKYMLHMSTDGGYKILAYNFDKDTTLLTDVAPYPDKKYSLWINDIDTLLPRYNFKIIIDTSYTIGAKDYEYKTSLFQKIFG